MLGSSIVVEVLTGTIYKNGMAVELSRRERYLMFSLAAVDGVIARARLRAMLWPDSDDDRADNALWITVHRVRRRLGCAAAISTASDGYRLGQGVLVDLAATEALSRRIRLGEVSETTLQTATQTLAGAAAFVETGLSDLPEHVGRRSHIVIDSLSDALHALLGRGDETPLAVEAARALLAADPAHEAACECIMRSSMARGNLAAAVEAFRRHRRALRDELEIEPSPHLLQLLQRERTPV